MKHQPRFHSPYDSGLSKGSDTNQDCIVTQQRFPDFQSVTVEIVTCTSHNFCLHLVSVEPERLSSSISHFQKYSEPCAVPFHHHGCDLPSFPALLCHGIRPNIPKHTFGTSAGLKEFYKFKPRIHTRSRVELISQCCVRLFRSTPEVLHPEVSCFHSSSNQSQSCSHKQISPDGFKPGGKSVFVAVCFLVCF